MNNLTRMTRLEIVVPARDAPAIRELISSAGATGYTSVSGVSGVTSTWISSSPSAASSSGPTSQIDSGPSGDLIQDERGQVDGMNP